MSDSYHKHLREILSYTAREFTALQRDPAINQEAVAPILDKGTALMCALGRLMDGKPLPDDTYIVHSVGENFLHCGVLLENSGSARDQEFAWKLKDWAYACERLATGRDSRAESVGLIKLGKTLH